MKKALTFKSILIATLAYLLISTSAFAQSPQKMSYQAVVRNSIDNLVTNKAVGMQISILQGSAAGSAVYKETQTPTSNDNGLVSLEIGAGTVVSGTFATIDWSAGPYFIKTETDPTGGTNYTVTGTSQLLSVPYALYAKTSGSAIPGPQGPAGKDGVDGKDGAVGNTGPQGPAGKDGAVGNTGPQGPAGKNGAVGNTGAQGSAGKDGAKGAKGDTGPQGIAGKDGADGKDGPSGTQTGEMLYWNGSKWVTVHISSNDSATLLLVNNVPTWVGGNIPTSATPNVVSNTGKIWMDRDLGASQVATGSADALAYGGLYQWGRATDGHEKSTSSTTATLSPTDTPGNSDFITSSSDWRTTPNDSLWQGVNGINNPCPSGYRLPTEAEITTEYQSWGSLNAGGAYASPLKFPAAGFRLNSNGMVILAGSGGGYWTSTFNGSKSMRLSFASGGGSLQAVSRASGYSVRCIKN